MDKNFILNIKQNNYNLNESDAKKLEDTLVKYPYFKFGHFLLLKHKFENKAPDFNDYLMKTAVFADNRAFLYDFLHKKPTTHNQQPTTDNSQPTTTDNRQPTTHNPQPSKKTKQQLQKEIEETLKEVAKSTKESAPGISEKEESKKAKEEKTTSKTTKEKDKASVDKSTSVKIKEEKKTDENKSKTSDFNKEKVIDKFLQENPKINKPGEENYSETERQAKESLKDNLGFVSETLADIYAKQGNKKMAKQIYEQLMLKNPEKKLYFAGRIKKLDNNK